MFAQSSLGLLALSTTFVSACIPELYSHSSSEGHHKRQSAASLAHNAVHAPRRWTFDLAHEWNSVEPDYGICFSGSQQSPIAYESWMGSATHHKPHFHYPDTIYGDLFNWDFGPKFDYLNSTFKPSMTFEENGKNETVYFKQWHSHAPSEHTIDGYRAKAEIHIVHYDADNNPRAVVGILIDRTPYGSGSKFFEELTDIPDPTHNQTLAGVKNNLNLALKEVNELTDFFTYEGSLTTPPCKEGLRWFVGKEILYVSDEQMQALLGISTYSARPVNSVWLHNVNI